MNQTNYYYDSYSFGSPPTTGRLLQKETGVPSASLWQRNHYDYWRNFGSLQREWVEVSSNTYITTTETYYDSRFQAYPVCVRNNLGHKTVTRYYGVPGSNNSNCPADPGAEAWSATTPYPLNAGAFFGLVQDQKDPNNAVVSAEWDAQGRIVKIIQPGNDDNSTNPTVRFTYTAYTGANQPFQVKKETRDNAPGGATTYLQTYTFYDGLGQVIQTQSEGRDANKSIITDTKYGAEGQVVQQNVPYFGGPFGSYRTPDWTKPATKTIYDALGRVTTVTTPDAKQTRTYYRYQSGDNNLLTAVIDAANHQTITETDAWGQLIKSKQYSGAYPGGPGWNDTPYAQSSYVYDTANRLTDAYGADNARTQNTYDGLGRKTQMVDPDMGTWTYAYDQIGNLTRQTDSRSPTQTICFYYDTLNRLTGKHYRSDQNCPTSGAALAVVYSYDAGSNGTGRRTGMANATSRETWNYDGRGRLIGESRFITSTGTFSTTWLYDSMDRVVWQKYPKGNGGLAGEQVNYTYNASGLLATVVGANTYVSGTDYNALGQVMTRTLTSGANGLKQLYSYPQDKNYRLGTLKSGTTTTNNNLQNMTYTYDNVGNVLTIQDAAAVGGLQTQTFTYDPLDRVVTAVASGGGTTYGEYAQKTYGYANNGNLTAFEGVAQEYTDAAHPHAVTKLGGTQKYWYDGNGNATKRIASDGTYEFVYDAENRLTQLKKAGAVISAFKYDGDGNRIWESTGGVTTIYGGAYFEWTSTTLKKYYYANGARVAMLDGATLKYLLADHLGSTAITTNNTGTRQTELRYFAYGKTRYAFGAQPTSFKYTGQRQQVNANEMYFYGARWYDAYLNRWIQPDPTVPRPGDPQSLNRYSYAANNPLRFVDPSGLAECAAGDQQCWTNEWNWKNRWYNAHGYSWGGSHWSVVGNPTFADEGITDDVISEAGISLASAASPSPWSWDNKKKVAYGAASIGQSLSTGMAGLRALLGGHAQVTLGSVPFYCNGGCAPPPPWADGHTVFLPIGPFNAQGLLGGAQWVVHELAHVMDWQGNFSTRWNVALTQYAEHANTPFFNEQRWDRWAEAVAVWAFGGVSAGGGFVTSYKPGEVGQRINANALTVQMDRLHALLEGW